MRRIELLLGCLLAAGEEHALDWQRDAVVLRDGRIVQGRVVAEEGRHYLVLPHGRLPLPPDQVDEVLIDPTEAALRAAPRRDGFVRFEDAWVRVEQRDRILAERRQSLQRRLADITAHYSFEQAWVEETAHFRVRTNTSPELLRHSVELLEALYDAFERFWKLDANARARGALPEVQIYRDYEEYVAYGGPPETAGFFDPAQGILKLFYEAGDPRSTDDVLFHEGTHLLLNRLRPGFLYPVWANEGLAEYFSTARLLGGRLEVGGVPEGRRAVWRKAREDGKGLSLRRLLATEATRFTAIHYAGAASFVQFLLEHPRYGSRFRSYIRQLASARGVTSVPVEVADAPSLSTVSLADARRLLLRVLRVSDLDVLEAEWRESMATDGEEPGPRGWVVAGRLYFRDGQFDEALAAMENALRLGSTNPLAPLVVARVYALRHQWAQSVEAFRRAVALDPLNPAIHREFGLTLRQAHRVDSELRAEGERHLALAQDLAPGGDRATGPETLSTAAPVDG